MRVVPMLASVLLLWTCSVQPEQTAMAKIQVAVSVPPQAYLVERIGGDRIAKGDGVPTVPRRHQDRASMGSIITTADVHPRDRGPGIERGGKIREAPVEEDPHAPLCPLA